MLPRLAKFASQHVLYVDGSVIVLNKFPGLVCQPAFKRESTPPGYPRDDFARLLYDLKNHLNLDSLPYSVHRLDKPTTGALLLARTAAVARELSQQFKARTVEKTYLALVRGGEMSFEGKSGKISVPLGFDLGRVALSTTPEGKLAETDWDLIGSSQRAPVSLLRLRLHTGLKHQIRVHLAHALKTPIVGDGLYSRTRLSESVSRVTEVPDERLFLHASKLSVYRYKKTGPKKRCRLSIVTPVPIDFLKICSDLDIQLEQHDIKGGLFVDDVFVKEGEVADLDGRWMGG